MLRRQWQARPDMTSSGRNQSNVLVDSWYLVCQYSRLLSSTWRPPEALIITETFTNTVINECSQHPAYTVINESSQHPAYLTFWNLSSFWKCQFWCNEFVGQSQELRKIITPAPSPAPSPKRRHPDFCQSESRICWTCFGCSEAASATVLSTASGKHCHHSDLLCHRHSPDYQFLQLKSKFIQKFEKYAYLFFRNPKNK